MPRLLRYTQERGGIKTKHDFKKFIGSYEDMVLYFIRMGYDNTNWDSGENLWKALSTDLRREVNREFP